MSLYRHRSIGLYSFELNLFCCVQFYIVYIYVFIVIGIKMNKAWILNIINRVLLKIKIQYFLKSKNFRFLNLIFIL